MGGLPESLTIRPNLKVSIPVAIGTFVVLFNGAGLT